MADINEMSPKTGRFLTEDNERRNLADILGAKIRPGSLHGSFAVTTTAAPLRFGAANLEDRHTVHVINDSAVMVYVGFTAAVTAANGIPVGPGEERGFELDANENVDLYIIGAAAATIRLLEIH